MPLTIRDLTVSKTIFNFLSELHLDSNQHSSAAETQTEDAVPDLLLDFDFSRELDAASIAPFIDDQPQPPFVALSSVPLVAAQLSQTQIDYLGRGTLVDLFDGLFNPFSSNIEISSEISPLNRLFIERLLVFRVQHPHIKINKYVYQHPSDDVEYVAKHLCRLGYFVYDLFMIQNRPTAGNATLNRYVLYSCDTLSDHTRNNLSAYVRLSNRY